MTSRIVAAVRLDPINFSELFVRDIILALFSWSLLTWMSATLTSTVCCYCGRPPANCIVGRFHDNRQPARRSTSRMLYLMIQVMDDSSSIDDCLLGIESRMNSIRHWLSMMKQDIWIGVGESVIFRNHLNELISMLSGWVVCFIYCCCRRRCCRRCCCCCCFVSLW